MTRFGGLETVAIRFDFDNDAPQRRALERLFGVVRLPRVDAEGADNAQKDRDDLYENVAQVDT